jgi:hypothetical protein
MVVSIQPLVMFISSIDVLFIRSWKGLQLRAANEALEMQWNSGPASRTKSHALALSAALLWRINALHSRPATGGSVHEMHKNTLPLTTYEHHIHLFSGRDDNPHSHALDVSSSSSEDEGEDLFLEPINPHGAIFLRAIRLPGDPGGRISCPRMDARFNNTPVDPIPPRFYKGLVGMLHSEILQKYGRLVQASNTSRQARRLPRPRTQLPFPPPPGPAEVSASVTLPDVVTKDFVADYDEGDDLDEEERMPHPVEPINHQGFTDDVNKVLNAFCSQVLQFIPPPKRKNSIAFYHQSRNPDEPYTPSLEHYMNLDLWLGGFTQVQTREPHRDDWDDRFEYLFPPKFRIMRQNQYGRPRKPEAGQEWNYEGLGGYKSCTYLETWMNIMSRCTSEGAKALRARVKTQFFDTLIWCPWSDRHKMWTTSITPAYSIHLPSQPLPGHGSPRICVNPAKKGMIMWEGSLVFPGVVSGNLTTIGHLPARS